MVVPLPVPWPLVAVVLAFPVLYVLNSFSPWALGFFRDEDQSNYNRFWGSTIALHWASASLVGVVLVTTDHTLADVGLVVPGPFWLAVTILVGVVGVGSYLLVVGRAPAIESGALDLPREAGVPRTRSQRVTCFVGPILSAGIVEELVYRGFAILALAGLGLPIPAAVPVASVLFVFVHGMAPLKRPVLIPIYFAFGVGFGIGFILAGSLLPVMAVHAAFNALQVVRATRTHTADDAGSRTGFVADRLDG